jgi:hypothetical protein
VKTLVLGCFTEKWLVLKLLEPLSQLLWMDLLWEIRVFNEFDVCL